MQINKRKYQLRHRSFRTLLSVIDARCLDIEENCRILKFTLIYSTNANPNQTIQYSEIYRVLKNKCRIF